MSALLPAVSCNCARRDKCPEAGPWGLVQNAETRRDASLRPPKCPDLFAGPCLRIGVSWPRTVAEPPSATIDVSYAPCLSLAVSPSPPVAAGRLATIFRAPESDIVLVPALECAAVRPSFGGKQWIPQLLSPRRLPILARIVLEFPRDACVCSFPVCSAPCSHAAALSNSSHPAGFLQQPSCNGNRPDW